MVAVVIVFLLTDASPLSYFSLRLTRRGLSQYYNIINITCDCPAKGTLNFSTWFILFSSDDDLWLVIECRQLMSWITPFTYQIGNEWKYYWFLSYASSHRTVSLSESPSIALTALSRSLSVFFVWRFAEINMLCCLANIRYNLSVYIVFISVLCYWKRERWLGPTKSKYNGNFRPTMYNQTT